VLPNQFVGIVAVQVGVGLVRVDETSLVVEDADPLACGLDRVEVTIALASHLPRLDGVVDAVGQDRVLVGSK
jgi:hypothetical protein